MSTKTILHKLNRKDTRILPSINTVTKIVFIALIAVFLTYFSKNVLAATNVLKDKQDAIEKGNNQEAWLNEAMGSNMVSVVQMMTGKIPFNADGSINVTSYTPGGAIGVTNNMIAKLYNQPVSGVEYIAQVKDNFLGKPAYAQGVGYEGLQPLLPLWRTLRNTIYILASLVFVIVGIMIMLRVKISPQAVVTIQSAIPKIITTLILVTFSYAIAGLIIDLSNLFLSICLSIFFTAKGVGLDEDLFGVNIAPASGGFILTSWLGNAIMWLIDAVAGVFGVHPYSLESISNGGFSKIYDLTTRAIPAASGVVLGEITGQIFLGVLLGGVGSLALGSLGSTVLGGIGSGVGNVVGGILGGLLMPIILSILIIIWLIKLYFGLLKCYITLIFKILIGPLEIGIGAFPNSKMGFSSWIKDIIANISVFPITVLFLVFINYLTDTFSGGGLWAPSQLSMLTLGGNDSVVAAGIGLAGLGMLSKLPKMVPEFIFSIKPSPWGKAMGESYAPVMKGAELGARSGAEAGAGKLRQYERMAPDKGWAKAGGYVVKGAEMSGIIKKEK